MILSRHNSGRLAFTIIELLIVIAIIAGLAALSVPAIKGLTQSHNVKNAAQQLIDDLALARQYAMHNRAYVHVLFVPPSINTMTFPQNQDLPKRLMTGVYTTYAFYAERSVGDQPGRPRPRYLSKWKSLPEGVLILPDEFTVWDFRQWDDTFSAFQRPFLYGGSFPFPTITNAPVTLPHITFDPQGRLSYIDQDGNRQHRDEAIELVRGSILAARDEVTGNVLSFDARTNASNNRIYIDGLTGRARVQQPEVGQPQP